MAETQRLDAQLISGSQLLGDAGGGVLGANIPASGPDGASILNAHVTHPADDASEFRLLVTAWPATGSLFVEEDGSFRFIPAGDGSESFSYQVYKDYIQQGGTHTVTLNVGVAAQDVTLPLLNAAPTLIAPTLVQGQVVTLPLLNSAPTLIAPTVTVDPPGLVLPLLNAAPTLHAPSLVQGQVITLPVLDKTPVMFAPTVSAAGTLVMPLLGASPVLFAPVIVNGSNQIVLPVINAAPVIYAPTISGGAENVFSGTNNRERINARILASRGGRVGNAYH